MKISNEIRTTRGIWSQNDVSDFPQIATIASGMRDVNGRDKGRRIRRNRDVANPGPSVTDEPPDSHWEWRELRALSPFQEP